MKDIYDILYLAEQETFTLEILRQAIVATFTRRETSLDDRSALFLSGFTENREKVAQWKAFLLRIRMEPTPLDDAMQRLAAFMEPVCDGKAADSKEWRPHEWRWERVFCLATDPPQPKVGASKRHRLDGKV